MINTILYFVVSLFILFWKKENDGNKRKMQNDGNVKSESLLVNMGVTLPNSAGKNIKRLE